MLLRFINNTGELFRIVGQRAFAPIVHQQQQISAMLGRVQMGCIRQVISDCQRHPNIDLGFHLTFICLVLPR